jgi:hypothetical protein
MNTGKSRVKIMHINSSIGRKLLNIACKITKRVYFRISKFTNRYHGNGQQLFATACNYVVTADRQTDRQLTSFPAYTGGKLTNTGFSSTFTSID